MIVLSPHLDDAVWSCHGLLQGATVITICAGIPDERTPPNQFDVRRGFRSAADAMRARRAEDLAAAAIAGYTPVHLNHLDCTYGGGDLELAVAEILDELDDDEPIAGPLGLRHPDHVAIAAAFTRLARDRDALLYEELPYAYRWPEDLAGALQRADVGEETLTRPGAPDKAAAVAAYTSQLHGAHTEAILAPERYHPLNAEVRP